MPTLAEFKKICTAVRKLEKEKIKFDVNFRTAYINNRDTYVFHPSNFVLKTVKDLAIIQAHLDNRPIHWYEGKIEIPEKHRTPVVEQTYDVARDKATYQIPSVRFFPNGMMNRGLRNLTHVKTIVAAPPEHQIGDRTYRTVCDAADVYFCVDDEHKYYQYLDKGFSFVSFSNRGKENLLITNELTLDTWLCIVLCALEPMCMKHLVNECYLPSATAKVTRAKMERIVAASPMSNQTYTALRTTMTVEFEKSNHDAAVRGMIDGKATSCTYNDVKLTPTRASYENINIEAPDFLDTLKRMNLNDHTDIYAIIRQYIEHKFEALQAHKFADAQDGQPAPEDPSYNLAINGLQIRISRTRDNTRRYVNDHPINIAEVEAVVFRASCFHDQNAFDAFIKEVSKMSLKWHDILANGLKVKVHPGMSYQELRRAEPPANSPRLKFKKVGKEFFIVVGENQMAKIKFNKFITKVSTINRKTSGRSKWVYDPQGRGTYITRNGEWCATQIAEAIRECCTFPTKVIVPMDAGTVGEAEGATQEVTQDVCGVTLEQSTFICRMANELQDKAIERSKVFLANAMKATGATKENWKGHEAYIVKGKLRSYAIKASDNKVYDSESGRHICIVEPGHKVGVGFDALAARLYALANDSRMTAKITTLA